MEMEKHDMWPSVLDCGNFKNFQHKYLNEENNVTTIVNLSRTQLGKLPFISKFHCLSQLLLRECSKFQKLPSLKGTRLQVIDLSGTTTFREFEDESLGNISLQILNLSGTQVSHLPSLSGCKELRQLLLRGCPVIQMLPPLESVTSLVVIDLSGATSFNKFQDESLWNISLQILNLSGTQVSHLPSLSGCKKLRQLLLRGCPVIEMLPPLESLTSLVVIDLSGATSFNKFQDESLGRNRELRVLDLSKTQVVQLPSLSGCRNLCQLLLRDCLKLEELPNLEALTGLKVLDLARATALRKIADDFFKCMYHLEKLDISGVAIELLPSSISVLSNLRHLILKNCASMKELVHLEAVKKLEVLDISGTEIRDLPPGISKLNPLGYCNRNNLTPKRIDWGRITEIPEGLSWELCSGFNSPNEKLDDRERPWVHATVTNSDIFNFINKSPELWDKCLRRFNICLCPHEEQGEDENISVPIEKFVFRVSYIQARHFLESKEPERFLEIRGINSFPSGMEGALNRVEILLLKNNKFISRLSDLRANDVKLLRECWIERCNEMETAFCGEEAEENVDLGRNLEKLWFSNLSGLRYLWTGLVKPESFKCLKHVYIDCCPRLVAISSRSLQLENLETLQIKFCDQIENLFGEMVLGQDSLPRLQILTLWQLQKLNSICEGELPSLQKIKIKGCPKLRKLPLLVNSSNSPVEIEGEMVWWSLLTHEDISIESYPRFIELRPFL